MIEYKREQKKLALKVIKDGAIIYNSKYFLRYMARLSRKYLLRENTLFPSCIIII